MFGSSRKYKSVEVPATPVYDRFASLRQEVKRLQRMVEERENERKAVEEEKSLQAEIATLRTQLGIA